MIPNNLAVCEAELILAQQTSDKLRAHDALVARVAELEAALEKLVALDDGDSEISYGYDKEFAEARAALARGRE